MLLLLDDSDAQIDELGSHLTLANHDARISEVQIPVSNALRVQARQRSSQLLQDFLKLVEGQKLLRDALVKSDTSVLTYDRETVLLDDHGLDLLHALYSTGAREGQHFPTKLAEGTLIHKLDHQVPPVA